jgi:hypothetical protein
MALAAQDARQVGYLRRRKQPAAARKEVSVDANSETA